MRCCSMHSRYIALVNNRLAAHLWPAPHLMSGQEISTAFRMNMAMALDGRKMVANPRAGNS